MIFAKHLDTTSWISYLHDQDTKVDTKVYRRHFQVLDVFGRTSILIVDIQYQSVQRCIHANIEYLRSYLRLRIGRLSHWPELRYDKYRCARKTRRDEDNFVNEFQFERRLFQEIVHVVNLFLDINFEFQNGIQLHLIFRDGRPFFSYICLDYIWLVNYNLIWWSSISIWLTKTLSSTRLKDSFSVNFINVS